MKQMKNLDWDEIKPKIPLFSVSPKIEKSEEFHRITIDEGQFKGWQFTYDKVTIDDSEEDVQPVLKFSYNVHGNEVNEGNVDAFEEIVASILISLIESAINETLNEAKNNENSEELNTVEDCLEEE